jgi:5-methylcytosine-specific restriction endonuclease McrA
MIMNRILLLNASYEPLRVIGLPRAIGLLMSDKVDVIETWPNRELRSPTFSVPMPSVLRLRYYVHVPRRGASWSRRGVLVRDRYTCQYCGKVMRADDATLDHIIPQWKCRADRIPPDTWSNTVAACARCQQRKGGRRPASGPNGNNTSRCKCKLPKSKPTSAVLIRRDYGSIG